jgi:prepilin-type N-terminal cleavage/methylation domain-containing protein
MNIGLAEHPKKRARSGLTLLELVVVLVILAILTTIAIQSTESLVDQGRYNATQQTLQNIQAAIIGPPNQRAADGSLLITGFVADMGRLPQTVDATSEPLRELWDTTVIPATSAYGIQTFPNAAITNALNSTSAFGLVNAPGTAY